MLNAFGTFQFLPPFMKAVAPGRPFPVYPGWGKLVIKEIPFEINIPIFHVQDNNTKPQNLVLISISCIISETYIYGFEFWMAKVNQKSREAEQVP
jgi:hypothetical protein